MDIGVPRVAVCVPAGDTVETFFAYDYARLLVTTARKRPQIKLYPMINTGSLIPLQREQMIDMVLTQSDATHVLWLDSDMRFPGDALLRLLDHNLSAVCAGYTERKPPFKPVAYLDPSDWDKRAWTKDDSTGLQEIAYAGLGLALIARHVFEGMTKPRHMVTWVETTSGGGMCGEDMFFWLKMTEQTGTKLFLDHDLTKEVAHLGRFEFTPEHAIRAEMVRQREQEAEGASVGTTTAASN